MEKGDYLCMGIANSYSFISPVKGSLKEANKNSFVRYSYLSTKGPFFYLPAYFEREAEVSTANRGGNLKELQCPESPGS